MADITPQTWAAAVLQRLGIHQTPGAVQALTGWANAEGGHWHNDAKYNPLNTTQPAPGAGNTGTQGNIKVYKDWQQGLDATVQTLRNGRYGGILKALQSGNPNAVASAIGQTPWGTSGSLVQRTIAGTPRVAGVHAFGAGSGGSSSAASPTPTAIARTVGGVDNSQARAAAVSQFLGSKSADPLDFALQVRGLRDTPGQKVTSSAPTSAPSPSTAGVGSSRALKRADAIAKQKLPYQWGGGHHAGGAAPGQPLDCSGAVSKVLGINPRVSGEFQSWGQPGDGGNSGVTVYSNNHHVLMKINGHFFGTSASNPGGGAGWIPASQIGPQYLAGFTARHSQ